MTPCAPTLDAEGRTLLDGWDVQQNYQRAEDSFRKAIALDDNFAEAHAFLAMTLWKQYREVTHDVSLVEQAHVEAQRAVALQPDLPEAQLAFGTIELGVGHSPEAAAAFAKARNLAPADDNAVCRAVASA